MAKTGQILDTLGELKEVSYKNFEAGDKVLLLLNGVKITLDNTRDENRQTIANREAVINERNEALAARDRQIAAADRIRQEREIEYQRQANALDMQALELRKTSEILVFFQNKFELTAEELAQVQAAKAEADAAYAQSMQAKDALLAAEVKAKLDALDQVTKLGSDIASLQDSVKAEQAAREAMIVQHEADNDKVLALVQELFTAEKEEDKDLRDASAAYEGGYENS